MLVGSIFFYFLSPQPFADHKLSWTKKMGRYVLDDYGSLSSLLSGFLIALAIISYLYHSQKLTLYKSLHCIANTVLVAGFLFVVFINKYDERSPVFSFLK